jgi:hypothetical protein
MNCEDVGMIERGGSPRLLLEAAQPLRVRAQTGGEHLDRDIATEPRIAPPR